MTSRDHPVGLAELVDYLAGDLSGERAAALEEHLFECDRCAAELDNVARIGAAVRAAVRRGAVGANVTAAFVERVADDGLTVREYRLEEGQTVACSAGPEDLFVVRLAGEFGGAGPLRLEAEVELATGRTQPVPTREVELDRHTGEIVLAFPGDVVRGYPRSVWTLEVAADSEDGPVGWGPFVLDHSP
jgi:hypothetical protein